MEITASATAQHQTFSVNQSTLARLLCILVIVMVSISFAGALSAQTVFINEIHYDNAGTDAGEAIEVAGAAGTDLTGWAIVLYNGSTGASYNTTALSGTIPDMGGGFGFVVTNYPVNGVQNGGPDGIALVDGTSAVVQFLSYEGSFAATDGPASGMTSTDIGVVESSSTPAGDSLQLVGSGSSYADFSWAAAQANTFAGINTGQAFTPSAPNVFINEIHYDNASTDAGEAVEVAGSAGTNLAGWTIALYNGSASQLSVYGTISLAGTIPDQSGGFGTLSFAKAGIQNGAPDGLALVDPGSTVVQFLSYEGTFTAASGPANGMTSTDIGVAESSSTPAGDSLQLIGSGTSYEEFTWGTAQASTFGAVNTGQSFGGSAPVVVLINEVDADQSSTDSAEFVELYDGGAGNTSLDGKVLVFMNGSDDASYQSFDLDGLSTNVDGYFVLCGNAATTPNCDLDVSPDTNLIQNGADAVALYAGDASDFPNDTPVTTSNLLDALVYDTSDSDDAGLLVLLNVGQPQVNEDGNGAKDSESNQRCLDGSGGARNTDTYGQYTPTPGAANCEAPPEMCGDPTVFIHEIQGSGQSSPLEGTTVSIEGIVVGDFQDGAAGSNGDLNGFFIQEEDADADGDPSTSEGIFVFDGYAPAIDVQNGDKVRVSGTVTEFFGLTEINNTTFIDNCAAGAGLPTATAINLPLTAIEDWEATEGMLVTYPQTLYVTNNFTLARYGELDLSVDSPLDNPTNVVPPGEPALALQDLNDRSRIQLDDGSSVQNPQPLPPYLNADRTRRVGDNVTGLTGVLNYSFGAYQVEPTETVVFVAADENPTGSPDVGPSLLKVAGFNVLNYFTTLDDSGPICGPLNNQGCRGADNAVEFTRQKDKLVAALSILDADVVGLIELENAADNTPIADLVDGVNAVLGDDTYAYIETGAIGDDAIRQGIMYKPDSVSAVGAFAVLDDSVDPSFNDDYNRPVLAQTFSENSSGKKFTVAINHLKSKGSDCNDLGDVDTLDGQGNCNLTRTSAASALANWLASDPTASGVSDSIILGDLNAYAMEDPVAAIVSGGYADLINAFVGTGYSAGAYSFSFMGQAGYLDHALASPDLVQHVSGVAAWHINSDEPSGLDYNDYNQLALFNPDQFRSSDHDAVVVGLFVDSDSDGVLDPRDMCPNTVIPESVPTLSLGTNRYALVDGDGIFDTTASNGKKPQTSFSIVDTAGCSCEQIIEAQELGKGHTKYGCSLGEMKDWVELVTLP